MADNETFNENITEIIKADFFEKNIENIFDIKEKIYYNEQSI